MAQRAHHLPRRLGVLPSAHPGYEQAEIGLCFSLTLPQVAATLAATTVAYRTANAAGVPLMTQYFVRKLQGGEAPVSAAGRASRSGIGHSDAAAPGHVRFVA